MANWCDNYVCVKGEQERVRQVYELASLAALELTEGFGKLPDFVDEPDGFFVEIKVLDDGIEYQTRWLPNGDAVRKVADHLEWAISTDLGRTVANFMVWRFIRMDCWSSISWAVRFYLIRTSMTSRRIR